MRLGLFGGTFDPPHLGHLIAAQDARLALGLERVVFVPARVPPHKRDRDVTSPDIRLDMLRSALAADSALAVDDLELRRDGPSYTVDTLREYRRRDPAADLYLLMGADQYAELATWREPGEIRRLARIAVLSRDGERTGADDAIPVAVTRIDISATEIRRRVASGLPIRYLVPAEVEAAIRRHHLYV